MNAQIKRQLEHDQLESEMWRKSYYAERSANDNLRYLLAQILVFLGSHKIPLPKEIQQQAETAIK